MFSTSSPYGSALLPLSPETATDSTGARLYTRTRATDPERMGGTVVKYDSFDDFLTTFEAEARDPNVVGAADVLDIINPLQHLPVISNLYRGLTDDQIKPGARMMGGAVFGGGMGLASSSVNAVIEEETGRDLPSNLISALTGEESFTRADRGLALKEEQPPEEQLNIILGDENARTRARSPQQMSSAYRRAAETISPSNVVIDSTGAPDAAPKPARRERVVMADPERMAGSFVRYA